MNDKTIDYFRVPKALTIKTSLSGTPFTVALTLALKQRLGATRKWSILTVFGFRISSDLMNNIDIGGCYPPRPYNPSDHTLACENIRFSSLFVAEDVSR